MVLFWNWVVDFLIFFSIGFLFVFEDVFVGRVDILGVFRFCSCFG